MTALRTFQDLAHGTDPAWFGPCISQFGSDASGDAAILVIHPDNTRTLTTIEGNLRASVATLDSTGSEIHSTSYLYDALRRPIAMTDSRTGTVSFTQTSGGVPLAHDDPNALPAYTESGNLLCQRDSGGRATRYAYDVMCCGRTSVNYGNRRKYRNRSSKATSGTSGAGARSQRQGKRPRARRASH
ncbi:hypothetical protein [Haloferula sargassicola]|uniref:YD repeat-containing protein n=1 Tax=Haloferula sargassicola TaxID=490096 RepID=A0ABP9UXF4_9BACT